MMSIYTLKQSIQKLADPKKAEILRRFFKTGPGEYGEGDLFLGITVPPLRKLSKQFQHLNGSHLKQLVQSKYHEERLLGLFILVLKFKKSDKKEQKRLFDFYVKNRKFINNWDLIDLSAQHIVGAFLEEQDKSLLYEWALSGLLWERRISILSTFYYIKKNQFSDSLKIAKLLLNDEHDLIHKAVGWMLREIGKRDLKTEESFLKKHYKKMPRTMLRYAIERFPEPKRQAYLKGNAVKAK